MKRAIAYLPALFILSACSLLRSPPAEAGTVVITWVNPLTNTDDTPIPATQGQPEALQTWRIEYGTCNGSAFGTTLGQFTRTRVAAGPELTTATQNLPAGQKCFRVFVANTAGGESDASNIAARDIPAGRPRPPTNVQATLQGS